MRSGGVESITGGASWFLDLERADRPKLLQGASERVRDFGNRVQVLRVSVSG